MNTVRGKVLLLEDMVGRDIQLKAAAEKDFENLRQRVETGAVAREQRQLLRKRVPEAGREEGGRRGQSSAKKKRRQAGGRAARGGGAGTVDGAADDESRSGSDSSSSSSSSSSDD